MEQTTFLDCKETEIKPVTKEDVPTVTKKCSPVHHLETEEGLLRDFTYTDFYDLPFILDKPGAAKEVLGKGIKHNEGAELDALLDDDGRDLIRRQAEENGGDYA